MANLGSPGELNCHNSRRSATLVSPNDVVPSVINLIQCMSQIVLKTTFFKQNIRKMMLMEHYDPGLTEPWCSHSNCANLSRIRKIRTQTARSSNHSVLLFGAKGIFGDNGICAVFTFQEWQVWLVMWFNLFISPPRCTIQSALQVGQVKPHVHQKSPLCGCNNTQSDR